MENTRNDVERKKAFDATVCFSFFGTWLEAIEAYETEADTSSNAYKLFKAIAYYSMMLCGAIRSCSELLM